MTKELWPDATSGDFITEIEPEFCREVHKLLIELSAGQALGSLSSLMFYVLAELNKTNAGFGDALADQIADSFERIGPDWPAEREGKLSLWIDGETT